MNTHDLIDVIGDAKGIYIAEAQKYRQGKPVHRPMNSERVWLIAAVIALMLLLVGCVAAALGMLDMKIGEYTPNYQTEEESTSQSVPKSTVLSLQGFVGSKNYRANKEWFVFSQSYQAPEGGEIPMGERIDYLAYGVFWQEQIDKIDAICAKYDLNLLGHEWMEEDAQATFDAVGIDGVFNENAHVELELYPGYYYSNGTFRISGNVTLLEESLNWPHAIGFSLRCSMKESLDTVYAHIDDIASFAEWTYILEDGTELLMALSPDSGFMFADFDDFFVTISVYDVLAGDIYRGQYTMDKTVFEALADTFDLSFHPQPVDEEAAQQRRDTQIAAAQVQAEENRKRLDEYMGVVSFDARVKAILGWLDYPEHTGYALHDLDGNGEPELFIGRDGDFTSVYAMKDGETWSPIPTDGTSSVYLCEDNVVASISNAVGTNFATYWYVKLEEDKVVCVDELLYNENAENKWERGKATASDGTVSYTFDPWDQTLYREFEPISEAEAQAIIASHPKVFLDTYPLLEYPLEEPVAGKTVEDDWNETSYTNYEDMVIDLLLSEYQSRRYSYAMLDVDGDGLEELLLGVNGGIQEVYTIRDGMVGRTLGYGKNYAFCEGGIVEETMTYPSGNIAYFYYQTGGTENTRVEYLRYDPARNPENPWFRSTDATGQDQSLEAISETEFDEIRASYTRIDLDIQPITEYPIDE